MTLGPGTMTAMQNPVLAIIEDRGWCVADGATGSNFFGRGLEAGYPPELWCLERPDDVLWLHRAFLSAGSDLILTNSFGGNALRLKLHNAQDRVHELNSAAARLARQAVTEHEEATGRRAVVAGSMGPTGELFAPMGALGYEQAVACFTDQAEALAEGGADVLWIETMSANEEVAAAAEAGKKTGLPVCATMTFDTAKRSMMGVTPADFAREAEQLGLSLMGSNCGVGPAELMHSTRELLAVNSPIPVVAKGNCGIPEYVDGAIHYHGSPELMAQYAVFARDAGAKIIGGCCGTTPVHVAAMVQALNSTPVSPFDPVAMETALGIAWKDLPPQDGAQADKPARRGRRRKA